MSDDTELLRNFRAHDEHLGCTRTVTVDAEGILTVMLSRDTNWAQNQDSHYETRTFRLVEVEQRWVEVDRD